MGGMEPRIGTGSLQGCFEESTSDHAGDNELSSLHSQCPSECVELGGGVKAWKPCVLTALEPS